MRDLFRDGVRGSRFTLLPSDGTYFQCARYDAISHILEANFAEWLSSEIKVAATPVSALYRDATESGIVRFCFAKKNHILCPALDRLTRR